MRFTKTIASASVAAVLGLAGVSVAGASPGSSPSATTSTVAATGKAGADKPGAKLRRHLRRAAGAVIAKTIGIERRDLRRELLAGKTIAAIATEHGVAPRAVIDALTSAANTKIDAARAAGRITEKRADKLKARFATAIPKIVNQWHPRRAGAAKGAAKSRP